MDDSEIETELPSIIIPKSNNNWKRKPAQIKLKTLALQMVMENFIELNISKKPEEINSKVQRDELQNEIPHVLLDDLGEFAQKSFLKQAHLMTILELLPFTIMKKKIDFLGKYRGTHCCLKNNCFLWMSGVSNECLLDLNTVERLFALLDKQDKTKIKRIALWTENNVIVPSKFPRIIANSSNLNTLILRGDADDHILRIIGLNCHALKYLDVSRSPKITAKGLRNLVLKSPNTDDENAIDAPKNKIVDSIATFISTVEEKSISRENIILFGKLCTTASSNYCIYPVIPEYTLNIERTDYTRTSENMDKSLSESLRYEILEGIASLVTDTPANIEALVIDSIQTSNSEFNILMFNKDTHILYKRIKIHLELGITTFNDYWENPAWVQSELIDLACLGRKAPNLHKLSARLVGCWDHSWGQLFPNLEEVNCWCLFDDSIRSLLKYAPSLRLVNLRHVVRPNTESLLTHKDLVEILEINKGMKSCLEEFMIRPTKLIKKSILEIHRHCPNIRRIGDLEVWSVNSWDIEDTNKFLLKSNSQCVLVVLDYPPNI